MTTALRRAPRLTGVSTSADAHVRHVSVEFNLVDAAMSGISMADFAAALYNAFGQRYTFTLYTQANQYRVIMTATTPNATGINTLNNLYLATHQTLDSGGARTQGMEPFSAIAALSTTPEALTRERANQLPAITFSFNLFEGHA